MFFVLNGNKLTKKKIQKVSQYTLTKKELLFINTLVDGKPLKFEDAEDMLDLYGSELEWFVNKLQRNSDLYITLEKRKILFKNANKLYILRGVDCMTNKEIQELDTLIEESENERIIFLYRRMRRTYNRFFINSKIEIGSKQTLLITQEKEIDKLNRTIKKDNELITFLREQLEQKKINARRRRQGRRRINEQTKI